MNDETLTEVREREIRGRLMAHAGRDLSKYTASMSDVRVLYAEVRRLRAEVAAAEERRQRVGWLLGDQGCECECGHDLDGHDADCASERCFPCRVEAALFGAAREKGGA